MDWQTRVISEKRELDARIGRLEAALDGPQSRDAVSLRQFDLMRRQLGYMRAYSLTLAERISEFQGDAFPAAQSVADPLRHVA